MTSAARSTAYQQAFRDAFQKIYWSYNALWVCCTEEQSGWITTEGIRWFTQPVNGISAYLDRGGPEFLFKFLRVVSPNLPFERIVEADLEFLVQELNPIFYPHDFSYTDHDMLTDAEDKTRKWFPEKFNHGSICIDLENEHESNPSMARSTLAALRLAAFCILGSQILVVDRLNAISSFNNTYQDPSGSTHYIFEILHLETIQ